MYYGQEKDKIMPTIRIKKNKDNPYVMINRKAVHDKTLSWKAKGLLSYLLSLPDNWQLYESEVSKHSKSGLAATKTAFKELINANYIYRIKKRYPDGKFAGYEYEVYESPQNIKEISRSCTVMRKSVNGKSHTTNIDSTNNDVPDKMIQYHNQHNQVHDQALRADVEAAGLTWTPNMTRH